MNAMDWSLLLPELLDIICTKLPEISDIIRFRVVCKAWRSSSSLKNPSPFLPWILIYNNQTDNGELQFYSPFSDKTFNIHAPEEPGACLIGATEGYFISYNYTYMSLSLLNPFTANEIPLPPLDKEIWYPLNYLTTPQRNKDQIIILGKKDRDFWTTLSFGISQPGNAHWVITKLSNITTKFSACAYYNSMIFISEQSKQITTAFDAITGDIVSLIPDFKKRNEEEGNEYLVESGGKLLRIFINNDKLADLSLDVYVLNINKGYRWLEIKDIDDHILFLDWCSSFSLTSRELHGLRGNCIYFFSHMVAMNNEVERRCCLHRYEMGNSSVETLPFPSLACGTWIIPSMC